MEIVNNLSVVDFGNKEVAKKVVEEKLSNGIYVGSIVGHVVGTKMSKVANPTTGEFTTKLKGDFYGRTADGKEFQSATCILPNIIHDTVLNALANSDGDGVEFGVKIGMKFVEGRSIPYQWTVEPLTKVQVSKPLERLINLIPGGTTTAQIAASDAPESPKTPATPAAAHVAAPAQSPAKTPTPATATASSGKHSAAPAKK